MKLADFRVNTPEAERSLAELVATFNRTAIAYPRDRTVHAVFRDCAAQYPDAVAVRYGAGSLTYSGLEDASNRLARLLVERQLAPEGFVAVLLDDGLSLVTALLGTLKAGGAYCPIETDTPYERIRHIVNDARCAVLLTQTVHRAMADRLRRECPSLVTQVFVHDGAGPEPGADIADGAIVFRIHAGEGGGEAPLQERAGPDRLAYVTYTSGTSGQPKGVLIEHRSILRLVLNANYVPLNRSTCTLMTGSVAFDASTFEIWGSLLNGGMLIRADKVAILDPSELQRLVRAHGATTMWLTSSLFNHIVDADVAALEGIKYLLVGGERLSPTHVARARRAHPGLTLINGYGPTENTTFTTCHTIDADRDDIPIGRPIANSEVLILDSFGELCPPGVPGEIFAAGDGLARGYLNDAALTAGRFAPHPFRHGQRMYGTRDRGRWTERGVVEFLGRMDTQLKIRGYRIEPGEIESCLRQVDGVEDAAIVPLDRPGGECTLVAYLSGPVTDVAALRENLRRRLPAYMLPRHFVSLDRFPLNSNGKLDVRALPQPDWSAAAAADGTVRCETETEAALTQIWQEVLGVDRVGATDNFFEVGGHSLKVTKIVTLVHQRLGVEVPLAAVFRSQTVREFARVVIETARYGTSLADETMVLLGGRPDAPALFALPPGTGDVLSYIPLANRWPDYRLYAFNFIEADSRFADYAELIMATQPEGPYVLLGYSAGGNLAFHVAAEIERRGRRVSTIVMIDSARILAPYPFLEEDVQRTAAAFLSHPTIQPYCSTPVLRDKVVRRITGCYRLFSQITDKHCVHADIDVVLSEDKELESHHDGQLITSVHSWAAATSGAFKLRRGKGNHNEMLFEPAVDANARLIKTLLDDAVRRA